MKFLLDKYFEEKKGNYPFFKYCPKKYWDYYINKRASYFLKYYYDYREKRTLNERVRWLVFHENLELKSKLSDKILMKSYTASKIGKGHTAELYGTYNNFDEIDFSVLPDKFVIKANHGWRMNIIVNNKNFIYKNKKAIKETTKKWLSENFFYFNIEPQYKDIKRKLLVECKREENGKYRQNLQVHCINSEPVFIEWKECINGIAYSQFYDINWKLMPYSILDKFLPDSIERPKNFDEILEYSKVLSDGFSYVRIDFATDRDDIQVEEFTFTPYAGMMPFSNYKFDLELGQLFEQKSMTKEKSFVNV